MDVFNDIINAAESAGQRVTCFYGIDSDGKWVVTTAWKHNGYYTKYNPDTKELDEMSGKDIDDFREWIGEERQWDDEDDEE